MASKFSYCVEEYSNDYILCVRMREGSRNTGGDIVGETMFCLLPDGERVELLHFFTYVRDSTLLASELLRQFERLVRFFQRSAVWLETTAKQKKFYAEHGYQVITERGQLCYMQKELA